ncbi:MAG: glycosyltransferase [Prevotellaceae bacterium]|jgi:glycosyltransferase involved in cell wall biosynthesis|nr:glycosyltransferase [Prevotellaceae bacterium]
MKVSIIIPVYNVEPYIERCLLSALNQTYQNLEIILIDDCGQDNSMSVARAVAENHPNRHKVVFLKHEQNRGLSAARNTGIDAATGDYVYFLDSDDELPLNSIENLFSLTVKYKPDFVLGNIASTNTIKDWSLKLKNIEYIEGNKKILHDFIYGQWYEMAWNKLLNKKFLLNNNLFFYPGIYHEDNLWSFQLAATANSMAVCYDFSYIYHVRENSISQTLKLKNVKDLIFVLNETKNIIKNDKKLFNNREVFLYYDNLKFSILSRYSKSEFMEYTFLN